MNDKPNRWTRPIVPLLFAAGLAATLSSALSEHYLLISIVLALAAGMPFYIRFERKRPQTREMVLIALLAAVAAVSRIPFASLPSVQPVSFVIICSSLVFGAESGFLIGSLAALVSNMFLGQGPWTPWQMFGWGMMGFSAGLLRNTALLGTVWGRAAFGFVWGFLFGWIMNLTFMLNYIADLSWSSILAAYASSFPFDLAHALCNVFFLSLFGSRWIKLLNRYKLKYGIP